MQGTCEHRGQTSLYRFVIKAVAFSGSKGASCCGLTLASGCETAAPNCAPCRSRQSSSRSGLVRNKQIGQSASCGVSVISRNTYSAHTVRMARRKACRKQRWQEAPEDKRAATRMHTGVATPQGSRASDSSTHPRTTLVPNPRAKPQRRQRLRCRTSSSIFAAQSVTLPYQSHRM